MAVYRDAEDPRECPVCYDGLSGAERTLSCGHVFCHDCLVKTVVNGDGIIRDSIVCPVCRHLTFIRRRQQQDAPPPLLPRAAGKDPEQDVQTLEVRFPVPAVPAVPLLDASRDSSPWAAARASRFFRWMCWSLRQPRLRSAGPSAGHIFIISAQGRPMAEEDALRAAAARPQRARRRTVCTSARCLLLLLSAFTLLALVAATLPWILLA